MIKSITAINYLGDRTKITLNESEPEHGLLLMSAEGLGPTKGQINTMKMSTADGSKYNSATKEERNIVLKFRFTNDVETTRQLTYTIFPVKQEVILIFETDNNTLWTMGYVESNEPNIFSNEEGNNVSIICPDAYFYTLQNRSFIISTVRSAFEFEFSSEIGEYEDDVYYKYLDGKIVRMLPVPVLDNNNDNVKDSDNDNVIALIVDDNGEDYSSYPYFIDETVKYVPSPVKDKYDDPILDNSSRTIYGDEEEVAEIRPIKGTWIEFGNIISDIPYAEINNPGTVEVGVIIYIRFSDEFRSNIVLFNETTGEKMSFDAENFRIMTGDYILPGDEIIINTMVNHKSAYLNRNNEYTNILNCLEHPITWINVVNGENVFYYRSESDDTSQIEVEVEYQVAFEGI